MKNILKFAAIATVLTLASATLQADQTNLVRGLNFRLVGLSQGPSMTNRSSINVSVARLHVGTADVIAALGAATGNTFSSNAQLVLILPLPAGAASTAIRDGSNSVDVSSLLVLNALSGEVSDFSENLRSGKYSGDSYSLEEFVLQDAAGHPALTLHFDVRGIADDAFVNYGYHAPGGLEAHVTGLGDSQGGGLLFRGQITESSPTLEVVAGGAPPPPPPPPPND